MPLAAVVIMACSRADYLERTVNSVLKSVLLKLVLFLFFYLLFSFFSYRYQSPIASKYPLFISQDGSNQAVKSKSLTYTQLTYMQVNLKSSSCDVVSPYFLI